jgi:ankyrin repeat protein
MVLLLFRAGGADVDAKTAAGDTALHLAALKAEVTTTIH